MTTMTPVNEKDRLRWIDAARGFALFGILVVNIGAFSAPFFIYGGEGIVWNSSIDRLAQAVIDIFFQASFYTLFSFLFGFGLQLMKDRLTSRHVSVYPILIRRMLILTGIGLVHAFLIWHGDILLTYGIIGLISLLFLNQRDKTIRRFGISLLVIIVGLFTVMLYSSRQFLDTYDQMLISQAFENYQSSSMAAILSQNYQDWMYANGGIGLILSISTILPLFLFGMYVARKRWLHQPTQHRSILFKLWFYSSILFLILKLGPYFYGNPAWFSMIQDNIGGTFSALFYITSVTLIAQTSVGEWCMRPFVYVGRMALSNYISQSVICFLLFYGIGIGLYGKVSPILGIVMAIVIYSLQVVYSKWWFTHYQFGPLEWVWRSLTYKKKQTFRRRNKSSLK
ncbi:DUF418 domain-containing protein [Virgibacillus salexigens]|uniref:DUF418 domain-containing protein n=1 Tax=Virgibacillus salexigens TaxID=61016 RepID=UPI00190A1D16|nr:DUF418 domain-containing protein [Virgibacillus salexigens]